MKMTLSEIRNARKGYSFIELIVVLAIMIAVVGVSFSSVSLLFKSRSRAAAQKIEAMITQSKVNSLSGRKNKFTLVKNPDNKSYTIALTAGTIDESNKTYKIKSDGSIGYVYNEGNPYESVRLDGRLLKITTNNEENPDEIELTFKSSNGKLEKDEDVIITVSFGKTYEIIVHHLTGSVEMKAK